MIRFIVEFKDRSKFLLFGEEFFNDKRVFSNMHYSQLISFREEVCKKDKPIKVFDKKTKKSFKYLNSKDFDNWFFVNQSNNLDFGFSYLTRKSAIFFEAKKRIEMMIIFLEEELNTLKTESLNPWRIDGGYKYLLEQTTLAICSLDRIRLENKHLENWKYFDVLIEYFTIPSKLKYKNETIISIAKLKHEELNADLLINLCEMNLRELIKIRKEKLIIQKHQKMVQFFINPILNLVKRKKDEFF